MYFKEMMSVNCKHEFKPLFESVAQLYIVQPYLMLNKGFFGHFVTASAAVALFFSGFCVYIRARQQL